VQADLQHNSDSSGAASRRDLRDLLLAELEKVAGSCGEREFRARQVANWLYRQRVDSFDRMTNLPAPLRAHLENNYKLGLPHTDLVARSLDGTRKLVLRLDDGEAIESVIIPAEDRVTLCISSQAGCAMGCTFCATALMGLHRNLEASEIVGQVIAARKQLNDGEELTNYVFMGMGEPLANYQRLARAITIMTAEWGMGISPRRITVSTVGLAPMMEKLLNDTGVNLAVSLTATTDEQRDRLVPINRRYPLEVLLDTCRHLPLANRRRITFEYVMLKGVNDSPADAARLIRMLAPLRAKVNLIFFNPFEGAPFESSARPAIDAFQAILHQGNLTATIRESRGRDIAAACGQLRRQSTPEPRSVQAV